MGFLGTLGSKFDGVCSQILGSTTIPSLTITFAQCYVSSVRPLLQFLTLTSLPLLFFLGEAGAMTVPVDGLMFVVEDVLVNVLEARGVVEDEIRINQISLISRLTIAGHV